jgi:adenosine kinase
MNLAGSLGLEDTVPNPEAVIVGPNAPDAMQRLVRECRQQGVPWVFDPAHQLPHMSGDDLVDGARGAWVLIGNDYELELIQQRTGRDLDGLKELSELVVTTLGRQGSRIDKGAESHTIAAASARVESDPTGAGDAYRAGLVAGLLRGLDIPTAGAVASLAATYAVEQVGTIEHTYSAAEFSGRFGEAFGLPLPAKFWPAA